MGSAERMHQVANLVQQEKGAIVVLSAVSGTTNSLVGIGEKLSVGNIAGAEEIVRQLESQYKGLISELVSSDEARSNCHSISEKGFNAIKDLFDVPFSDKENKILLAQGELFSTQFFHQYLLEQGIKAELLPALDFMSIDANEEPSVEKIEQKLSRVWSREEDTIYITQGYICLNHEGSIDNLKRGGSDYTASLIGAAAGADEVQIWTDIDGMHNNDPRIVGNTRPVSQLSFDEAAELAYFGAKILHPSTILPAQKYQVPVRLKNTMEPSAPGTLINDQERTNEIKAVAAKDGITAIKIKSTRMLLAHGFLRRVFEVFEKHNTSIDMITTSEIAVSLTIDNDANLASIVSELKDFGTVEIDREQSIICIVGNMVMYEQGIIKRVFDSLETIKVRMISFGGSKNNISLLVKNQDKNLALQKINEGVFGLAEV